MEGLHREKPCKEELRSGKRQRTESVSKSKNKWRKLLANVGSFCCIMQRDKRIHVEACEY